MGYKIGNVGFDEPVLKSSYSIEIDSDNLQIYASSLGNSLVTNGDMESVGSWDDYGSPTSNERSDEQHHTGSSESYSRKVVINANGGDAGISQTINNLAVGRKYRVTAWVYGSDLAGGIFSLNLGTNVYSMNFSNGTWIKLESIKVATATTLSLFIYIPSNINNASKTYYIDDVSAQEIKEGNLIANGIITGNSLTPNFIPALFGIHWDAVANNFEYTGGINNDLLSQITWSCDPYPEVVQNFEYYTGTNNIHYVTTSDGSRSATETLTWTGNNLTGYSISFS